MCTVFFPGALLEASVCYLASYFCDPSLSPDQERICQVRSLQDDRIFAFCASTRDLQSAYAIQTDLPNLSQIAQLMQCALLDSFFPASFSIRGILLQTHNLVQFLI